MQTSHSRRTYDYQIQEAICVAGDRDLFHDLEIPRTCRKDSVAEGDAADRANSLLLITENRSQRLRKGLGSSALVPPVESDIAGFPCSFPIDQGTHRRGEFAPDSPHRHLSARPIGGSDSLFIRLVGIRF
jgi:hypothetical protein